MTAILSRETREIEAELHRRELARRRLSWFLRYRMRCEGRAIKWAWYHDYVCELLEAQTRFELPRLMINMPPRHLKTELVCETWPAWMIGRDNTPSSSVVSASYGADVATRASARTMQMVTTAWYKALFPNVRLIKETEKEWWTNGGATRVAAGAGGPVTGAGGAHLIGDDLLKAEDANSETIREKNNEWYGETFITRRNDPKRSTETIVGQRLHERDICGHLLNQAKNPDAGQWFHVELATENIERKPKVYHFGHFYYLRRADELLHADRIGPKEVAQLKATMRGNYHGQYNQRPTKLEGGMLRPRLLVRDARPAQKIVADLGLQVNIYLDLATKERQTQKDDPDWSVLAVWARDQLQRKWLLHLWRAQTSLDVVATQLLALKRHWKPRRIKGEKIGLQHAFRSVMTTVCRLQRAPMILLEDMTVSADITQRLIPFESNLNAGLVCVPQHATWLPDFEAEMRSAPKGAHDDQVVTASYACNDLDNMPAGEAPPQPPKPEDGPPPITGEDLKRKREEQDREREGR